jgi:hypothetical protein
MSYGKAYDSSVQERDKNGNLVDKRSVAANVNNTHTDLTICGPNGMSVFIPKGAIKGQLEGHFVDGKMTDEQAAQIKAEMDLKNGVSPNTQHNTATNAKEAIRQRGIELARKEEELRIAKRNEYEQSNPELKAARLAEQKRQETLIRQARLARFAPTVTSAVTPAVTPLVTIESLLNSPRNLVFKEEIIPICFSSEAKLWDSIQSIRKDLRFHVKVGDLKIPSTYTIGYLLAHTTPKSEILVVSDMSEIPEPSVELMTFLRKLSPIAAN